MRVCVLLGILTSIYLYLFPAMLFAKDQAAFQHFFQLVFGTADKTLPPIRIIIE